MLAHQEEPSRGHAGGRTVEPQSEGQRGNGTIEIGAGQHENSIAAGELHDSGRQMLRQLMQNRRAGRGGAGEKNLVDAGSDGIAARLRRFVQQLQQCGIKAASHQKHRAEPPRRASRPAAGFQKTALPAASACNACTPGRNSG